MKKTDYEFSRFTNVEEDISRFEEIVKFEKERLIKFKIDYLDDSLVGISPNDLILIGGRSGAGKTQLALDVAFKAAKSGKVVYFFALEAEKREMGMRLLYSMVADDYYKNRLYKKEIVTFDRWIAGQMSEDFFKRYDATKYDLQYHENLNIRYSTTDYTLKDFIKDMNEIKSDAQLVVIDHLHYFDFDVTNNENAEYKKIVKAIRAECLEKSIPVILISHIRKMDNRVFSLVPEQEDFHGSSDIVKIATKAITIASGYNKEAFYESGITYDMRGGSPSFVKVVKHRRNGSVTHKTALLSFDLINNTYQDGYLLGSIGYNKLTKSYGFLVSEKEKLPMWAEKVINKND